MIQRHRHATFTTTRGTSTCDTCGTRTHDSWQARVQHFQWAVNVSFARRAWALQKWRTGAKPVEIQGDSASTRYDGSASNEAAPAGNRGLTTQTVEES